MSALTSLLVRDGVVPVRKIEEALQRQVISGGDVETVLLEMDAVAENVLAAYRAALHRLAPATRAEVMTVPLEIVGLVPAEVANEHQLIPLALRGGTLEVAVRAPLRPEQAEALGFLLGYEVQARIACEVRIAAGLAHHYGASLSPRFTRLLDRLRTRDAGAIPALVDEPRRSDIPYTRRAGPSGSFGRPAGAAIAGPLRSRPRRTTSRGLGAVTDEVIAARRHPVASIPDEDDELDAGPVVWPSKAAPPERVAEPPPPSMPPRVHPPVPPAVEVPGSLAEAERLLEGASSRDEILEVLFAFTRKFVDYAALFVAHEDAADGRQAWGQGAPTEALRAVSVPLDAPSVFAEARRLRAPLVRRMGDTEVERELLAALEREGPEVALVLPISIRQRVILFVYGARDDVELELDDVMELVRFSSRIVEALEQLILRRKRSPRAGALERSVSSSEPAPSRSGEPESAPQTLVVDSWAGAERHTSELPSAAVVGGAAPDAPPARVLGIPRSAPPPPPSTELDLGAPELAAALSVLVARGKAEEAEGEAAAGVEEDEDDEPELIVQRDDDDDDDVEIEISEHDGEDDDYDDYDDYEYEGGEPESAPRAEAPRSAPVERKPGTYTLRGAPIDVVRSSSARQRSSLPPRGLDADTRSVIVDMGAQVHEQVEELLRAPRSERDELIRGLLYMGEAALPALAQAFPGPLQVDRNTSPVPAGRDVSVVARALVAFGERSVPYVAGLLSSAHPDVRYYAGLVASELVHPDLMDAVRDRIHDPDPDVRKLACALLPRFAGYRGFEEVRIVTRRTARLPGKDPTRRWQAVDALVALRDVESLESLIDLLTEDDAELVDHVHRALVILTCADCGRSHRRWRTWYEKHGGEHRIEWLIEGLLHAEESVRALAGMELERLTQERYGFHAGAPKKDRERVHRQYRRWWDSEGASRFA